MRQYLLRLFGVLALAATMLLPGVFLTGAANPPGSPNSLDNIVDIDVSINGAAFVDPQDPEYPGRTLTACRGADVLVRLTVGSNVTTPQQLRFTFQGPTQQQYVGQVFGTFEGVAATAGLVANQTAVGTVTINDVVAGNVIYLRLTNNVGYNTMTAQITGFSGGGQNEFEINTGNLDCPVNPPGPPPPCIGGVVKAIVGIDLATPGTTFYAPGSLAGTGKSPAGTRVNVQPPGNNTVIQVQKDELVAYRIDTFGISSAAHPNLILKDRYQKSYQSLAAPSAVVADNGQAATYLGSGTTLPTLASIGTAFSYFDKNGEVYIFNVPTNGVGGYRSVFLITKVTAASGYITNNVEVGGKIKNGQIAPIPGVCRDSAESSIFRLPVTNPPTAPILPGAVAVAIPYAPAP